MSNHNYSQYSKKNNNMNDSVAVEETVTTVEAPVEPLEIKIEAETAPVAEPVIINETVETVTLPVTVTGTVINCTKLNVRAKPSTDAEVLAVLSNNSEISIDPACSNNDWLKITTTDGVNGFCMRKYVNAKL